MLVGVAPVLAVSSLSRHSSSAVLSPALSAPAGFFFDFFQARQIFSHVLHFPLEVTNSVVEGPSNP